MNRRLVLLLALLAAAGWPATAGAQARLENDTEGKRFVIHIGPVDVPASAEHHDGVHGAVLPPVAEVVFPVDAYAYGFGYDVVDSAGNPVPSQVVHHLNFIDPGHRELFLPISQRLMAAGAETGDQAMPWLLAGMPLKTGQRMVVSAMLHNPTGKDYRGVTVRFAIPYVPAGRPWPLLEIQPFQIDAAFPFGDKSWDLPPGTSSRSWEGKPAVSGRLLAIGGHLHEHATRLAFEDVTAARTIWEGRPYTDEHGNVNRLAFKQFATRFGIKLDSSHVYRVTVDYLNPSADTLPRGGMGVVAGVFLPGNGDAWPGTDTTDYDYVMDRKHYLREVRGTREEILAAEKSNGSASRTGHGDGHDHQH